MSRLHEVLVKGLDNVEILPHLQTEHIRTYADKLEATTGADSPRKGTRRNRIRMKTAKALGYRIAITKPWHERTHIEAGNQWKRDNQRGIVSAGKKIRKEGKSPLKG